LDDKEVAVPSFRRRASAIDADNAEQAPKKPEDSAKALALADEAEAEAAEAEAAAAAASARARAIRLRREAEAEAEAALAQSDDDDPASDDEPTVDDVEDTPASSSRGWGLVVKVVAMTLAVLCSIALVAASVYLVSQHRRANDEKQLNAEYAAAGRQSVVTLMSLDFNNAEDDVKRIIENSTGEFKTSFEAQAQDFVKVAQDSKVVTDVTVTAAAVESMDADSAVVLVAATSRVTNAAGAKQEPRAWRLSVDLQRDGGQIKMSKVEFVP
jgi:Mce-associated membrane protein